MQEKVDVYLAEQYLSHSWMETSQSFHPRFLPTIRLHPFV